MTEICSECNQCVPDNGICLGCGKQLPARELLHKDFDDENNLRIKVFNVSYQNEDDQYEGNE